MAENQILCESLLKAESEQEVLEILKKYGYWNNLSVWRYYGDFENNFGQSGNQQSLPEAALAEKIVNSVDARLVNECWMQGIVPDSVNAPRSVREAVAKFFDSSTGDKMSTGGYIKEWTKQQRTAVGKGITLVATGSRPKELNLTISDCGEGQTPDRFPDTILSLNKSNKQRIHFVQGQFNQGGTGALGFCGHQNLQLIVSRRNPALLDISATDREQEWGFTIVRREFPEDKPGALKNSTYTYLAPVGVGADAPDRKGCVLSFRKDTFFIFPDQNEPYSREAGYGTLIKMFDYRFEGARSNILRGEGRSLLSRLDLLLPKIAIPIRLYDYRTDKSGRYFEAKSRETTLAGLIRRLEDGNNLEKAFPVRIPFQTMGEQLNVDIFAFMPDKASSYRKTEGIIFTRNGQLQASAHKNFFGRDSVKMKALKDDILVIVDCDKLTNRVREDLIMTSRDRLKENKFKEELLQSLERTIRDCQELKDLRNRRMQERIQDRLENEKPLADVLQSLIKSSPTLNKVLNLGERISAPFSTEPSGDSAKEKFEGLYYPTFFKTKGVEFGQVLKKKSPINNRMRIFFETDARDDYFTRNIESGTFKLTWADKEGSEFNSNFIGPSLKSGLATILVDMPKGINVGDTLKLKTDAYDHLKTFHNQIDVEISAAIQPVDRDRDRNPSNRDKKGSERNKPTGLALPKIRRIYRGDWERNGFDGYDSMKIKAIGMTSDEESDIYEFLVNMDNLSLETEIKSKNLIPQAAKLLREQFMYANILIGLSLLLEDKQNKKSGRAEKDGDNIESVEDRVERTCRALASFIPAIITLGSSDLEAVDLVDEIVESA